MEVSVSGCLEPLPHHPSWGSGASDSVNKTPEKNNPAEIATTTTISLTMMPILFRLKCDNNGGGRYIHANAYLDHEMEH